MDRLVEICVSEPGSRELDNNLSFQWATVKLTVHLSNKSLTVEWLIYEACKWTYRFLDGLDSYIIETPNRNNKTESTLRHRQPLHFYWNDQTKIYPLKYCRFVSTINPIMFCQTIPTISFHVSPFDILSSPFFFSILK